MMPSRAPRGGSRPEYRHRHPSPEALFAGSGNGRFGPGFRHNTGVPVYLVEPGDPFPDPREAEEEGLVALTRAMTPEMIVEAYAAGIFPWVEEDGWYFWFSPDPRMVLLPDELHVSRRLDRTLRRGGLEVRLDTAFESVMAGCASAPRPGQEGTWIGPEFVRVYTALHDRGIAHSAEAWRDDRLVGGVYGLALGSAFFGESMFFRETDASKVAFVTLVRQLRAWGYRFVDCQARTGHLVSLGAREWSRDTYLRALGEALLEPGHPGPWSACGGAG